ncbi:MAG TPA: hypothetical protein QF469_13365, partial [Sphingomonas sanguinis]|nr:hypothetical protein [Sphingomonas sanguinis]
MTATATAIITTDLMTLLTGYDREFEGHREGVPAIAGRDYRETVLALLLTDKETELADAYANRGGIAHHDVAALSEMDGLGFAEPRLYGSEERARAKLAKCGARTICGVIGSAICGGGINAGLRSDA